MHCGKVLSTFYIPTRLVTIAQFVTIALFCMQTICAHESPAKNSTQQSTTSSRNTTTTTTQQTTTHHPAPKAHGQPEPKTPQKVPLFKLEYDVQTLNKLMHTPKIGESKKVSIWVENISSLENATAELDKLPPQVGIMIDPFLENADELITQATRAKRPWALVIATRTRIDGQSTSPHTFNHTKESQDFFAAWLKKHPKAIVFVPQLIDIDREIILPLLDLIKENNATLIIPPQLFSYLPNTCRDMNIPVMHTDIYVANNSDADVFNDAVDACTDLVKTSDSASCIFGLTNELRLKRVTDFAQMTTQLKCTFMDVLPSDKLPDADLKAKTTQDSGHEKSAHEKDVHTKGAHIKNARDASAIDKSTPTHTTPNHKK